MSRGFRTADGRLLRIDPLKIFGYMAAKGESQKGSRESDDISLVRYLVMVQGFSAEDVSELMGTVTPAEVQKVLHRQRVRLLDKEQETAAERLGIPREILIMHARAGTRVTRDWMNLPWFLPVLDKRGEESSELMWFNLRWLSERFTALDDALVFRAPDSRMQRAGIKQGDLAFIAADETEFEEGASYLVRTGDGIVQLRQARADTGAETGRVRKYVIPGNPDVDILCDEMQGREEDPKVLGKVMYLLTQIY